MTLVDTNAGDDTGQAPSGNFVTSHPWVVFLLAALIAVVLYELFSSKKNAASSPASTSSSATSTTSPPTVDQTSTGTDANGNPITLTTPYSATGDTSGLSTDANGNPVVFAGSDTFLNVTDATNSFNTTTNNSGSESGNTGSIVNTGPPVVTQPTPGTPEQPGPIKPKPIPAPPSKKGSWSCTYEVKGGDTLTKIAGMYHTTWPAIYAHNKHLINDVAGEMHNVIKGGPWNNIRPGEVLHVPCTGASNAPVVVPTNAKPVSAISTGTPGKVFA